MLSDIGNALGFLVLLTSAWFPTAIMVFVFLFLYHGILMKMSCFVWNSMALYKQARALRTFFGWKNALFIYKKLWDFYDA